jgi:hypothetical protein
MNNYTHTPNIILIFCLFWRTCPPKKRSEFFDPIVFFKLQNVFVRKRIYQKIHQKTNLYCTSNTNITDKPTNTLESCVKVHIYINIIFFSLIIFFETIHRHFFKFDSALSQVSRTTGLLYCGWRSKFLIRYFLKFFCKNKVMQLHT